MKKFYLFLIYILIAGSQVFPLAIKIRTFDHNEFTRIVFESDNRFSYESKRGSDKDITLILKDNSENLMVRSDLSGSNLLNKVENITDGESRGIRIKGSERFNVLKTFVLKDPFRVVFDVNKKVGVSESTPVVSSEEQDPEEYESDVSSSESVKRKRSSIEVVWN